MLKETLRSVFQEHGLRSQRLADLLGTSSERDSREMTFGDTLSKGGRSVGSESGESVVDKSQLLKRDQRRGRSGRTPRRMPSLT